MSDRPLGTETSSETPAPPPGYRFGDASLARSPISLEDFELLKQVIDFGPDDELALRLAGEILEDQVDAYLDAWYSFAARLPQLGQYSADASGKPIARYKDASRRRFRQWILDTCRRPFDQTWLDYQYEIGLRHHRTKKNQTDQVDAVPHIHLRYILAQVHPFSALAKPFLAARGHAPEDVEKMHQAWSKAVLLQTILWSYPYIREGDF